MLLACEGVLVSLAGRGDSNRSSGGFLRCCNLLEEGF